MKEKLNGKDLINIGIFSAIYFVIVFITAMLGMVPVLYPMLTVICPLVGGVVYMLFLTRVKKFGMIWIMSILMGILMLISGMSWYARSISDRNFRRQLSQEVCPPKKSAQIYAG